MYALSTLRKAYDQVLRGSFGESYGSMMFTAACYWQSSHCIPAQMFVTASTAAVLPLCCYGKVLDFMMKKR